jgi:hypothetical protein
VSVGDLLVGEALEERVGEKHHEDGVGEHHARRLVAGELGLVRGADRLIEGSRPWKIGHRQVHEDLLRHALVSSLAGV